MKEKVFTSRPSFTNKNKVLYIFCKHYICKFPDDHSILSRSWVENTFKAVNQVTHSCRRFFFKH